MKKLMLIPVAACGLFILALTTPAHAADKEKEITIKGNAQCAKCALKEADKCQNVIEVEKDGKKVKYYLVQNDVSKAFHKNVCTEAKKATATGTDKEVDGKHQFTAKKIELAK